MMMMPRNTTAQQQHRHQHPQRQRVPSSASSSCCVVCQSAGADVIFLECQCKLHARCIPVNCILSEHSLEERQPQLVRPGECQCPGGPRCRLRPRGQPQQQVPAVPAAAVTSVKVLPLLANALDRAVALRQHARDRDEENYFHNVSKDDGIKLKFENAPPEASYLLLSGSSSSSIKGSSTSTNNNNDYYQRTGRWTPEEVTYTEFLVDCFDKGQLLLEPGMKLGEFLGQLLLCKSSRLTKKMKHAKLSVRSYEFRHGSSSSSSTSCTNAQESLVDRKVKLASLEQQFIQSLPSDYLKWEMRFHLNRFWRLHLARLCCGITQKQQQPGQQAMREQLVDLREWLSSLDQLEDRALQVEENIRRARRKRLAAGSAGIPDICPSALADPVPSAAGTMMQSHHQRHKRPAYSAPTDDMIARPTEIHVRLDSVDAANPNMEMSSSGALGSFDHAHHQRHISMGLEYQAEEYSKLMEDIASVPFERADYMANARPLVKPAAPTKRPNEFLQSIIAFVQRSNLPFQHADIWVPSITKSGSIERPILLHSGSATRSDIDGARYKQLEEYGEHSNKFSFVAGVGLPGRVFGAGEIQWEQAIQNIDPRFYEFRGGDTVFGVKAALGIPIPTNLSRIVVCLYSMEEVPESPNMAETCRDEILKLCPVPKWQPVVEVKPKNAPAILFGKGGKIPTAIGDENSIASSSSVPDEALVDSQMASLLSDYMPLSVLPSSDGSFPSKENRLLPSFMSLRLLLLRPKARRSAQEIDAIDIIRKSYMGYTKTGMRSNKEIALLIVQDWQYLQMLPQPASNPPIVEKEESREQPPKPDLTEHTVPTGSKTLVTALRPPFPIYKPHHNTVDNLIASPDQPAVAASGPPLMNNQDSSAYKSHEMDAPSWTSGQASCASTFTVEEPPPAYASHVMQAPMVLPSQTTHQSTAAVGTSLAMTDIAHVNYNENGGPSEQV